MDHEPEPQKSAVSRKRSSSRTATRMSKRVKQVETESDEPPTKEVTPDKETQMMEIKCSQSLKQEEAKLKAKESEMNKKIKEMELELHNTLVKNK